jgi:CRP-like cAMP-binding protein
LAQRTLLSMPTPAQRVCAQLVQLSHANTNSQAPNVANAPTHQEIAIMINTTRETVTRVFQKLQAQGIIKRDGSSLHILNISYLQQVANGETTD